MPLADQDRGRWNQQQIAEGAGLVAHALPKGQPGPYQLQAAIAAIHTEADHVNTTDWPQILCLYDILEHLAPNPFVTLNRAVGLAMVHGPAAGLDLHQNLSSDHRIAKHHRLLATRAHLLNMAGDHAAAAVTYREAAARATSLPERRHLAIRAAEALATGTTVSR